MRCLCAFLTKCCFAQDVDMLLGLDMLKRHQCCIDLRDNVLRVGTTGTATPFLAEADLPERARLHKRPDSEQGALRLSEQRCPCWHMWILAFFRRPKPRWTVVVTASFLSLDSRSRFQRAGAGSGQFPYVWQILLVLLFSLLTSLLRHAESWLQTLTLLTVPFPAEETVNNLCAMGFSREEVVAALGACQGNADLAAGVLMGS
jgi:hypothetical protein